MVGYPQLCLCRPHHEHFLFFLVKVSLEIGGKKNIDYIDISIKKTRTILFLIQNNTNKTTKINSFPRYCSN